MFSEKFQFKSVVEEKPAAEQIILIHFSDTSVRNPALTRTVITQGYCKEATLNGIFSRTWYDFSDRVVVIEKGVSSNRVMRKTKDSCFEILGWLEL